MVPAPAFLLVSDLDWVQGICIYPQLPGQPLELASVLWLLILYQLSLTLELRPYLPTLILYPLLPNPLEVCPRKALTSPLEAYPALILVLYLLLLLLRLCEG